MHNVFRKLDMAVCIRIYTCVGPKDRSGFWFCPKCVFYKKSLQKARHGQTYYIVWYLHWPHTVFMLISKANGECHRCCLGKALKYIFQSLSTGQIWPHMSYQKGKGCKHHFQSGLITLFAFCLNFKRLVKFKWFKWLKAFCQPCKELRRQGGVRRKPSSTRIRCHLERGEFQKINSKWICKVASDHPVATAMARERQSQVIKGIVVCFSCHQ